VLDVCSLRYEFGPLFFATYSEKYSAADTKKKLDETVIAWVISGTRHDKCHPYFAAFAMNDCLRVECLACQAFHTNGAKVQNVVGPKSIPPRHLRDF
jgi:hypothetical protein